MGELADKILRGDVLAASRLMREIDDQAPGVVDELRALFPRTGGAYVVGVTGAPGTGKSSLADRLIARYRKQGLRVGVVAVDPTSPFTGGAILGDRIRMQGHATDGEVFIRSLATRGALGGLSRSTAPVVRVLEALGKDLILVETVGVGQDEVDVAQSAHTVVVVTVPAMGDEVQAIKAGILEIADVYAVNKADREEADHALRELRAMLELRPKDAGRGWEPPVVPTVATRDEGVDELVTAIDSHRAFLSRDGGRAARDHRRARAEFVALLRERLFEGALSRLEAEEGALDEVVRRIAERTQDPWTLAIQLAARLGAPERR